MYWSSVCVRQSLKNTQFSGLCCQRFFKITIKNCYVKWINQRGDQLSHFWRWIGFCTLYKIFFKFLFGKNVHINISYKAFGDDTPFPVRMLQAHLGKMCKNKRYNMECCVSRCRRAAACQWTTTPSQYCQAVGLRPCKAFPRPDRERPCGPLSGGFLKRCIK